MYGRVAIMHSVSRPQWGFPRYLVPVWKLHNRFAHNKLFAGADKGIKLPPHQKSRPDIEVRCFRLTFDFQTSIQSMAGFIASRWRPGHP